MRSRLLFVLLFIAVPLLEAAPISTYQHGTVIRMQMGDCSLTHKSFMNAFGTPQAQASNDTCPEYTLVTDKIVFIIVGKSSSQLVPLAEVIDFRLVNKELAVRVDDSRRESKFLVKEMTLRPEWERIQRHIEEQLNESPRQPVDTSLALKRRHQ